MSDGATWCPSSPADRPESVVLGVHAGPDGLTYLASPVAAQEAVALVPTDIEPTRVLRFASFCDQACAHRRGNDCGLVEKVSVAAPSADSYQLPRCHLRPKCQWWVQAGVDACRRCSLVETLQYEPDDLTRQIADPTTTLAEIAQ
jgi:hypothetical protein